MATKRLPSRDYLLRTLDYDPETGIVRWRHRDDVADNINARDAGKPAGGPGAGGMRIGLAPDGVSARFRLHRVIWKMVYGTEPAIIDHINGDFNDNRLCNLRPATHAENMRNSRVKRKGLKGVVFHKKTGRWHARIMVDKKQISLRYHDTEAAAHAAYVAAAARLHGEFARAA